MNTYLLLDSRNVSTTDNARLSVGRVRKHPSNPLFAEERKWEARFDNLYANVLYDDEDEIYKCWYSPFVVDMTHQTTTPEERRTRSMKEVRKQLREEGRYRREMGICYAVSRDGLIWEKPDLDVYPWEGENSNVLLFGPHGAGVFKDVAETDPRKRYKMFTRTDVDGVEVLASGYSEDGVHWNTLNPVLSDVKADTHNLALWVPEIKRYVAFTRQFPDSVRAEFRTESEDFIHWTTPVEVLRGETPKIQVYSMPVFPFKNIYLGLPAMFDTESDRVWTELAWSTDTVRWERIDSGSPLIPCGEERESYDWGCVYAASSPVIGEEEIRLYYGGSDGPHSDFRNGFFCLATLRPDGFAGYEQTSPDKPAVVVTAPIERTGGHLQVNADAEGGQVAVSVINPEGKVLAESTLGGTLINEPISLASFSDGPVQFRFEIRGGKLYSFALS